MIAVDNRVVANQRARTALFAPEHGIEVAVALHRLFPAEWKIDGYSRLLVNSDALERLKRGDSADEITRSWAPALENFRRVRARFLLYR